MIKLGCFCQSPRRLTFASFTVTADGGNTFLILLAVLLIKKVMLHAVQESNAPHLAGILGYQ